MLAILKVLLSGSPTESHYQTDLFLFILSSKEGVTKIEFSYQTSETPHIDGKVILGAEYDLWCSIKSRLNIQKIGLIDEHTGPEVDDLDTHLRLVLHQHVFRLQITVNHTQLPQKGQRGKQLYGKRTNVVQIQ